VRKRREQFLKLVCLVFAVVLVLQVTRLVIAKPFNRLTVPPLPSLPVEAKNDGGSNAPAAKPDSKAATNSAIPDAKTKSGTNIASSKELVKKGGTNAVAGGASTNAPSTNQPASGTNSLAASSSQTNGGTTQTNVAIGQTNAQTTETSGTNEVTATSRKKSKAEKTNLLVEAQGESPNTNKGGTNLLVSASTNSLTSTNSTRGGTNSMAKSPVKKGPAVARGGPGKPAELPPEIKDRVDRIVQGEILGQVIRPLPMALLGIAGESAMLRSPEGQTGLVKEGDSLGTLKLLQIGTNRVLVEVKGEGEPEKKELMIFAGLGSESLLPKETKKPKQSREPKKPDEPTKKAP
jgi:hypothetical protein